MKNALVFGGSRGIGFSTCNLLASRGWNVKGYGRSHINLDSEQSTDGWIFSLERNQTELIDAIVFSQGQWFSESLVNQDSGDYLSQYHSRVINPIKIVRALRTQMEIAKGSVTFVSSTRGLIGGVDTAPYSLACAAQLALVQGFAREYSGIRFNAVAPGLSDTALGAEVIRTGGAKPGAPMNTPEFVAGEIVRLIESGDNGKIIRVVDNKASEAKWSW